MPVVSVSGNSRLNSSPCAVYASLNLLIRDQLLKVRSCTSYDNSVKHMLILKQFHTKESIHSCIR